MTHSFRLEPGTIVTGKWKRGQYRIAGLLGEGANGQVYLIEQGLRKYALKVGQDAVDLQSEINVLRSVGLHRRNEPFLVEVDDYVHTDGQEYPFYIMHYVKGRTLPDYLQKEGADWFPLTAYSVLSRLGALHDAGWVFGDLKQENVLVGDYGRAELIDFGGVTAAGKSVRQFTELYDRGYWNAGARTADYAYDLFSFAVLCIQLHEGAALNRLTQTLLPQNRGTEELMKLVHKSIRLKPFADWIRKALQGEFRNAREAAALWQRLMVTPGTRMRKASSARWVKGLFAASLLLLAVTALWVVSDRQLLSAVW